MFRKSGIQYSNTFCGPWPDSWLYADRISIARYSTSDAKRWVTIKVNLLDSQKSPDHQYLLIKSIYTNLSNLDIQYSFEPYPSGNGLQNIRHIASIINAKCGTCIDLAIAFAGLCIGHELIPLVVVLDKHVLVAVSLKYSLRNWKRRPEAQLNAKNYFSSSDGQMVDLSRLRDLIDRGEYIAVECTGFSASKALSEVPEPRHPECDGRDSTFKMSFENAVAAGRRQIELALEPASSESFNNLDQRKHLFSMDIAIAQVGLNVRPYHIPEFNWSRQRSKLLRYALAVISILIFTAFITFWWYAGYKSSHEIAHTLSRDIVNEGMQVGTIDELISNVKPDVKTHLTNLLNDSFAGSSKQGNANELRARGYALSKAAIALAHLGDWNRVIAILGDSEVPSSPDYRAYLTQLIPFSKLDAHKLLDLVLSDKSSPAVRKELLQVLGHYDKETRKMLGLTSIAADLYENDDDPGIHGAAWWLLKNRQHNEGGIEAITAANERLAKLGAERLLTADKATGKLVPKDISKMHWFIGKRSKINFLYVPKDRSFIMGNMALNSLFSSSEYDDQMPLKVTIPHAFVISMTEITNAERKRAQHTFTIENGFASSVNWIEAATLCNRFSDLCRPNLTLCYIEAPGQKKPIKRLEEHLSISGFRLPTEAEWEYCARGGSLKTYCFGSDPAHINRYACWRNDTMSEIACFLPNGFGMFDVHGGLEEWCDDSASPSVKIPLTTLVDKGKVDDSSDWRLLCGGENFRSRRPEQLTVNQRNRQTTTSNNYGFRIVRTTNTFPPNDD